MMADSLFFGWIQFGSPGMLAWALAAALPVLIHLWRRRSFRQENWAAMKFLQAAMQKNARRLWAEKWLLLAVRVGILVLLAAALADPRWTSSSEAAGDAAGQNTHVVIVIDGSYSMGYTEGGKSLFEKAKDIAKDRLASGGQRETYSLVLMADEPQIIVADAILEVARIAQEIEALEITQGPADLNATLAEVEKLVRNSRVVFLTDLQQSTWNALETAECRSLLSRLQSMATLELIGLGKEKAENLAITSLNLDSTGGALGVAGREVQIRADIHNFGQQNRTQEPLQILVDGRKMGDERIDCLAGSAATFTFRHRFESPGEYVVEARLAEDGLALDNRRQMVVQMRAAIRVLCVGRSDDTRYLALALRPQQESDHSVDVAQAAENRLVEEGLREFDCLILSNVARLSAAEAGALRRLVESGGGLIVFLGDQAEPDSYNVLLADDSAEHMLPAKLGEIAPTGNYRWNPLDYRHPIMAAFRGFPQSGLLTTPIWKYVRLTPHDGAAVAVAFDNGDPALVETRIGRGRSLLLATAASPDSVDRTSDPPVPWTALPSWPSFPPLMHEMVRFAVSARGQERNVIVGDGLTGAISIESADSNVLISAPDGSQERAFVDFTDTAGRWRFGPVQTSGLYSVKSDAMATRYAANVDTRESDLTRLDRRFLPAEFQQGQVVPTSATKSSAGHSTFPVFRWLLAALAALLIGEPWLAWLFGRGRG